MPFEKIKIGAAKKSAYVAEQILEAINRGEYALGDKLPSERKIAESMGVSRIPVREALSALQLAGVVETITGDGTYVRESRGPTGTKSLALMILETGESPFEALRARKILELGIVSFLIDTPRLTSLPEIERVLGDMTSAVEQQNLDAYFRTNRDFHLTLAKATENSLLERFMGYLLGIMDQPLWVEAVQKYFANYEHIRGQAADRHRRIYEAICAKDKQRALKEMKDHFDETVEEIKKYL